MGVGGATAWVQARRTGRSRWSVAAPRGTPGRASGVVRPVSQSKRVRKAEAVALHGGHPGGLRLARARQQKAFHTGPSYGAVSRKISCLVWIIIGRQTAKAVCVRCACGVRARRLPSETRRRVCHVSSGDQHRSSKKDSSVGGCVRAVREGGGAGCAGLCGAVRPLSRQGISTACPLGTDLGMKVDLPRPPRGAAGGGGAGRGRRFGTRDGACCTCTRGRSRHAKPRARLQR